MRPSEYKPSLGDVRERERMLSGPGKPALAATFHLTKHASYRIIRRTSEKVFAFLPSPIEVFRVIPCVSV